MRIENSGESLFKEIVIAKNIDSFKVLENIDGVKEVTGTQEKRMMMLANGGA